MGQFFRGSAAQPASGRDRGIGRPDAGSCISRPCHGHANTHFIASNDRSNEGLSGCVVERCRQGCRNHRCARMTARESKTIIEIQDRGRRAIGEGRARGAGAFAREPDGGGAKAIVAHGQLADGMHRRVLMSCRCGGQQVQQATHRCLPRLLGQLVRAQFVHIAGDFLAGFHRCRPAGLAVMKRHSKNRSPRPALPIQRR